MTDFRQQHPNGIILALDQMSAYLQASLTRVWSPIGQTPLVWVSPQRDCVHFYGALNVISGQEVALPLPKMNADCTLDFVQHVLTCFPGRAILFLMDRASWHKGKVRCFIEDHPDLDLMYFPPGSPNLNPQEHVWKHAREAVGHLRDYPHIGDVRKAFQYHLDNTNFHFDWAEKFLPHAFSYGFDFI